MEHLLIYELRPGNYIQDNSLKEVKKLRNIDLQDLYNRVAEEGHLFTNFRPILITPEYLVKFGFEITNEKLSRNRKWPFYQKQVNENISYVIQVHQFYQKPNELALYEKPESIEGYDTYIKSGFGILLLTGEESHILTIISYNIFYVHQLQNIWYDLTGKELEEVV